MSEEPKFNVGDFVFTVVGILFMVIGNLTNDNILIVTGVLDMFAGYPATYVFKRFLL